MNIKEVRKLKADAEIEILKIIQGLSQKTGLNVSNAWVETTDTTHIDSMESTTLLTKIVLDVDL